MGILDLFTSVEPALSPANRLDQSVRELGRFYLIDPDTYAINDDTGDSKANPENLRQHFQI